MKKHNLVIKIALILFCKFFTFVTVHAAYKRPPYHDFYQAKELNEELIKRLKNNVSLHINFLHWLAYDDNILSFPNTILMNKNYLEILASHLSSSDLLREKLQKLFLTFMDCRHINTSIKKTGFNLFSTNATILAHLKKT